MNHDAQASTRVREPSPLFQFNYNSPLGLNEGVSPGIYISEIGLKQFRQGYSSLEIETLRLKRGHSDIIYTSALFQSYNESLKELPTLKSMN
ncbi:MAG: hypothetical protein Q8O89_04225 [Nanoarchaeota archaeon]|nr:hypothetical protein [Nanoarchaeota archaeon]